MAKTAVSLEVNISANEEYEDRSGDMFRFTRGW